MRDEEKTFTCEMDIMSLQWISGIIQHLPVRSGQTGDDSSQNGLCYEGRLRIWRERERERETIELP